MSAISDKMSQSILNRIYRDSTYEDIRPASIYLALSKTNPLGDGSGLSEPAGNGYTRVILAQSGSLWSDPSVSPKGQIHNLVEVVFPVATGSWGTITHVALIDSNEDIVWHGAIASSTPVGTNDIFRFSPGSLIINLT